MQDEIDEAAGQALLKQGIVGRVKLAAEEAEAGQEVAAPPSGGWTVQLMVVAVVLIAVMVGLMFLLLTGVFHAVPV